MVTLSSQSSQVQFSPARGAIVTSLKVDGNDVLYLDMETFRDPEKNVRGGIPVLFPICGPQAEHPDLPTMKQHGFARNLPWQVTEQSPSRAVLILSDNTETRALYPHRFQYTLTYVAQERGLRIEQQITNQGAEPMPLQYGFHPYFLAEDKAALGFELPVSNYTDNKSDNAGRFEGFDFDREEIDWAFPHPTARRLQRTRLLDPQGQAVRLRGAVEFRAVRLPRGPGYRHPSPRPITRGLGGNTRLLNFLLFSK